MRESVQQERSAFKDLMKIIPADKLIFLDESGCNRALVKSKSWAPRGTRARGLRYSSYGDNLTIIGAVGIRKGPFALKTLKGAVNSKQFVSYIKRTLVPHLRRDDVVIMDNLRPHHAEGVRIAIESAASNVLYLPPYSPDLNPIEFLWGPLKRIIERHAHTSFDDLRSSARQAWRKLSALKVENLYASCGWI
jgi:transposase